MSSRSDVLIRTHALFGDQRGGMCQCSEKGLERLAAVGPAPTGVLGFPAVRVLLLLFDEDYHFINDFVREEIQLRPDVAIAGHQQFTASTVQSARAKQMAEMAAMVRALMKWQAAQLAAMGFFSAGSEDTTIVISSETDRDALQHDEARSGSLWATMEPSTAVHWMHQVGDGPDGWPREPTPTANTGRSSSAVKDAYPNGQAAFNAVKDALVQRVLLAFSAGGRPFHVYTDASKQQLRAEVREDEKSLVIWPEKCNVAQMANLANRLERLGTLMLLCEFRSMPLSQKLHLRTDRINLTYPMFHDVHIMRWRLDIGQFGPTFLYTPGRPNADANVLFRLAIIDETRSELVEKMVLLIARAVSCGPSMAMPAEKQKELKRIHGASKRQRIIRSQQAEVHAAQAARPTGSSSMHRQIECVGQQRATTQ
ncbi:hypothetical protein ON010_g4473 [Phytophthora cinnamomi]|nr:hypothetical protein ON010_g4473 [Phytophthora cinnamomi]